MIHLFCQTARRMRVLLYILLGASAVSLAAGLLEAAGAYGAEGFAAFWPVVWNALSKTLVYGVIWLVLRMEASGRSGDWVLRLMLLGVFLIRAAAALKMAGSIASEGSVSIMTTAHDVAGLIAVLGVPALLMFGTIEKAAKIINVFSVAAMVSALVIAYLAVTGTLDGQYGWIEGLIGTLPESLFGVILAVFYGDVRRSVGSGG